MSDPSGFSFFYAENRRMFVWFWAVFSALVVAYWMANVLPFTTGGVVSTGQVAQRHCGSKASDYTYSYDVDGARYEGGGSLSFDHNGPCQMLIPGTPVTITYLAAKPWRSIGGTVRGWNRSLVIMLAAIAFVSLMLMPVMLYLRQVMQ